ncbi:MAG TPA: DUF2846 domain-containing protein [Candidatus Cybelea sp.]|nr:DUF2846 domain-containing protein [Candidatus Cybelea sp.]
MLWSVTRAAVWLAALVFLRLAPALADEFNFFSTPVLQADKARIYIYREASSFGARMRPPVMLNKEQVGYSVPGAVIFRDVLPGRWHVELGGDTPSSVDLDLTAGQTAYVRMRPDPSLFQHRIQLSVAKQKDAVAAMNELKLNTGGR